MTITTFGKIFKLWITFYFYWLINTLVTAHAKKDKSDFFYLFGCLFYGTIAGLILYGTLHWFDYHPSFITPSSSLEISNLSLEVPLDDVSLKEQKYLEMEKEKEEQRSQIRVWFITTLIVYYIVFSIK